MILRSTAVAVCCIVGPTALADSVVFDSISGSNGNGRYFLGSGQFGDSVTLAGSERNVTEISLLFAALNAATTDVQIRLYSGGVDENETPTELLWDSGVITGTSVAAGVSTHSFSIPGVLATDDLTWTVEFSESDTVGLALVDPIAAVGIDYDRFWGYDLDGYTGWNQFWFGGYNPAEGTLWAGFGATIRATGDFPVVPLPTAAWAGFGLIGVAGIARRLRS